MKFYVYQSAILLVLLITSWFCTVNARHYNRSAGGRQKRHLGGLISAVIPSPSSANDGHFYHGHNTRKAPECGFQCADGSCIKSALRCDGVVHCSDISDERGCTCMDRIGSTKVCDGYEDCPNGEDEADCKYGCGEGEISCSKLTKDRNVCIKLSQQCDGYKDCLDNSDELECFRLISEDEKERGYLSEGILQKRMGKEWFTVCKGYEKIEHLWLAKYAKKACEEIVGNDNEDPETSTIETKNVKVLASFDFVDFAESEATFSSSSTCSSKKAYKVTCPDPECGWPISKYKYPHRQISRRSVNAYGLTAKIVGGQDSENGAWTFLCGIYKSGTFHCGCSILNKEWVITAAHCFHGYEKSAFEIQVGMNRRNSYSPYEQTREVEEIHVHDKYDSTIFFNDIALLKVVKAFHLSKYVTTACLATDISEDPVMNQVCTVIGWGDTSEDGTGPDKLQQVDLPITHCKETFTKDAYQICAGVMEGGKDACQGDSGGPFLCSDELGRSVVHGLVSFGRGCARLNQAGVYTRVSAYVNWIESIVSGENAEMYYDSKPKYCSGSKCVRGGGECIFDKMKCNQKVDCMDASDETDCHYSGRASSGDDEEPNAEAYENVRTIDHGKEEHLHEYGRSKLCGPDEFQCKTTLSCISLDLKCNGYNDCLDATDEKQCSCGEIVKSSFPEFYCDGMKHCLDGSDELDCKYCAKGLVKCPLSDQCISEEKFCDGRPDCDYGDDENDCMRISKERAKLPSVGYLEDKQSRGLQSGYVLLRGPGTKWRIACTTEDSNFSGEVCPYLRLSEFDPESVGKRGRARSSRSLHNYFIDADSQNCEHAKVQCGEPNCGQSKLYYFGNSKPDYSESFVFPWLVIVLAEGKPICAGTLVNKQWILIRSDCMDSNVRSLEKEYLSVVAGFSKTTNIVASPMEQVKRINAVKKTGIVGLTLLKSDTPFTLDHFVAPICKELRPEDAENVQCVAVTVTNGTVVVTKPVEILPNCGGSEHFCLESDGICQVARDMFVYCTTDAKTWSLLGVVDPSPTTTDMCINRTLKVVNPFYGGMKNSTNEILSRPASSLILPPGCAGVRCTYGTCIPKKYICDGLSHCPDNLDERRCQRHYQVLRAYDDDEEETYNGQPQPLPYGVCPTGHFACRTTGNCVPISAFCDGIYDCGVDDLSDEPYSSDECTCRDYLELSAPERICDAQGEENCPDRSDEQGCPCHSGSFHCDSNSTECINNNLVCDSVKDCSNGMDEKQCTALSENLDVLDYGRSDKVISEGFALVRVRGTWHPYCTDQWSEELGEKICKFLQFRGLDALEEVEVEDQGVEDVLILGKYGNLESVPYSREDEAYHCRLAYINCLAD